MSELTTKKKTVEQFRTEIVEAVYEEIKKKTECSVSFIKNADYFNAKLTETKIEGFHKILGIIIDASTIEVKER